MGQLIDCVKQYCLELERHANCAKLEELNRRFVAVGGGGAVSAERDSKGERRREFVVESEDLTAPEIRDFIETFLENVEEDEYMMMTVSPMHTQYAVLQQERALLIAMLLRLMENMMGFLDAKQVKQSLRGQEFEIMSLLKRYKCRGDEVARRIFARLQTETKVLEDKHDDHSL